ncbi:hypothetical protein ABT330_13985 [Streptomyces sp. NPDC000658]|uniref:hypothetical protein n=1 Tax=Streptomyces sp. NPDC000658 TaxID=3154266 RepID=UPI00333084D8
MRTRLLVGFAGNGLAADTKRAQRLGATVVRRNSNGDVVMRDLTGALFGLTQRGQ